VAVKWDATFDTSFWTNAYRAELLPYVLERFALHYTPQVAGELPDTNPGGREFWRLVRTGEVVEATPIASHVRNHGVGERAAMNLAVEHPHWALLIDDRRPFQAARRMGLTVVCTPLLVVRLADERILANAEADALLRRLAMFNTVSPHLISEAVLLLRGSSGRTRRQFHGDEGNNGDSTS